MTPCAITGCTRQRRDDQLMCKEHWWMVPALQRAAVWRWWRARQRDATTVTVRAHVLACRGAIIAVETRLQREAEGAPS